jgi:hypothetical protein
MPPTPQNYQNHTRYDPPYHFFVLMVALAAVPFSLWSLWKQPGLASVAHVIAGCALVVAVLKIRTYPLKVQDRLIRLEERMRLQQLLPEKTRSRIGELTESQLVALRFASDEELPDLVEKVLAGRMESKEIKKTIRNWRPDNFRV